MVVAVYDEDWRAHKRNRAAYMHTAQQTCRSFLLSMHEIENDRHKTCLLESDRSKNSEGKGFSGIETRAILALIQYDGANHDLRLRPTILKLQIAR